MRAATTADLKALLVDAGRWDAQAESFCDEACLQRYLRARQGDVRKAAAMLQATLDWRKSHGTDDLAAADFADMPYNRNGWVYVDGNDDTGRTIVMFRKRRDKLAPHEHENYLRYMMFVLETAVKNMKHGQEQWVWILDLAAYSPSNAPALSVTLSVLQMLANHYPERLYKAYVVNAPSVFQLAWKFLHPFIDPVTRSKVEFVNTKDFTHSRPSSNSGSSTFGSWFRTHSSSNSSADAGKQQPSSALAISAVSAATAPNDSVPTTAAAAAGSFAPLVWMYNRPYEYSRHEQLLTTCW